MTSQTTESGTKPRLLVVDDEAAARNALVELLRDESFEVRSAADGFKALGQLEGWTPDVILSDLKMPGLDGVSLLKKVRETLPDVPFVLMTAFGSVRNAVEAVQTGADDYITKPLDMDQLLPVVQRLCEARRLRATTSGTDAAMSDELESLGILGHSKALRDVVELGRQVAASDASILILGENGTGKESMAQAVHHFSARREEPFVAVQCAVLNSGVLESELFGHEAGAFSGAVGRRDGRFAQAHGGTLFLDEIGELTPEVQVKLLRFLQSRQFERVGSNETQTVDVRIVAATHRDLQKDVESGRFREDLFYRLNVISLHMPTLRERGDDIAVLAQAFLKRESEKNRKYISGFDDRALAALRHHDWPGNVRQLRNAVERAAVLCEGSKIEPRHLPREIMNPERPFDGMPQIPGADLREIERYAILKTLEHVGGSTSKAAKILGISPRKIQYRLNEYRDELPEGSVPPRRGENA